MMKIACSMLVVVLVFVAANDIAMAMEARLGENGRYSFPQYLQCDPRWGGDEMGVKGPGERNTICMEGCAMTSTAMALAGLGVTVDGELVNPGTFNKWLIKNDGYLCLAGDCNNLNLTAPERLSTRMSLIGEVQKAPYSQIVEEIELGRVIHVAHVHNNGHFVLLTGSIPGKEAFVVHDPFYNSSFYPYANISDIISFKVNVYPLYNQCNVSWGDVTMGTNNKTICEVGCLMSSIASGLAGTSIPVEGALASPFTLNRFMQTHNGYVSGSSSLKEKVVDLVNPKRVNFPPNGIHYPNNVPFSKIPSMIGGRVPQIVIANVMHGEHFVLIVGYRSDGDTIVVNDPGFPRNTYSYSRDVVALVVFEMH